MIDFNKLFNQKPEEDRSQPLDTFFKQQNAYFFQEAFFKTLLVFCFQRLLQSSENPEKDKEYVIDSWKSSITANINEIVTIYNSVMKDPLYEKTGGLIESPGDMKLTLTNTLDETEKIVRQIIENINQYVSLAIQKE